MTTKALRCPETVSGMCSLMANGFAFVGCLDDCELRPVGTAAPTWSTWCGVCRSYVDVAPDQHFRDHTDMLFDVQISPAMKRARMTPWVRKS